LGEGVTGYFGFGFGDFESGRPFLIGVSSDRGAEIRKRQEEESKLLLGEPYLEDDMLYFPLVPAALDSDNRLATILETLSVVTGIEFPEYERSNYESSEYTGSHYKMLYQEQGPSVFGTTFVGMVNAIEHVSTALKVRYDARTSRVNDCNQYSVYASIPDDTGETREFVFGLFYHNWKGEGQALWVGGVSDREKQFREDNRLTGKGFSEDGYFYRAVNLSVVGEEEDLVEHVVGIARDILNLSKDT
jgi:hypothetical protein